jgi:hypothetical protein
MTNLQVLRSVIGASLVVQRGEWSGADTLASPYGFDYEQRRILDAAIAVIAFNVPGDVLEALALSMATRGDE